MKEITDPKEGALAFMHEKMNNGFSNRPSWSVVIVLLTAICAFVLIMHEVQGSAMENSVEAVQGEVDKVNAEHHDLEQSVADIKEHMVTKEDLKEFRSTLEDRIENVVMKAVKGAMDGRGN